MLALARTQYARIAMLAGAGGLAAAASFDSPIRSYASVAPTEQPLHADTWSALKLVEKKMLTDGDRPTYFFRFQLPANQPSMSVASVLLTRAPIGKIKEDGSHAFVIRPYTPISKPNETGHLDFAIKVYPTGTFTQHLATLKPGDVLDWKGPIPKISIEDIRSRSNVGMICGGTGLTPMLQVAEELLRTNYKGKVNLIYANVTPNDIMLKDRVDALAKSYPNFNVYYVVDKLDGSKDAKNWKGGVGYITSNMVKQHMPSAADAKAMVLVCGPPGLMKLLSGEKVSPKEQGPLTGMLKELNYTETQVYKF